MLVGLASLAPLLQGNLCHLWLTPAIKIVFLYWISFFFKFLATKIIGLKSSESFVHKRFQGDGFVMNPCNFLLWQSFKSWIKRWSNQCRTHLDFTKATRICKEFPLMSWGYRAWIIPLHETYSKGIKQCFRKNLGQHIPETTDISLGHSNFFWRAWNERNKKIPTNLQRHNVGQWSWKVRGWKYNLKIPHEARAKSKVTLTN